MIEAVCVVAMSVAASAMTMGRTRSSWTTAAAAAPIVGISSYIVVAIVQVVVIGRARPLLAVAITCLLLIAAGLPGIRTRPRPMVDLAAATALIVFAVAMVAAVALNTFPTRLTRDSLQYISMANLLTEVGGFESIVMSDLEKRTLSAPLLHTLGSLDGGRYAVVAPTVVVGGALALMTIAIL
jgi:hypothetical protein